MAFISWQGEVLSTLGQVSLICGSVVAPLGEKARPLEKDVASGASEWLEPLSTGATTGSTRAPTCSTAAALVI